MKEYMNYLEFSASFSHLNLYGTSCEGRLENNRKLNKIRSFQSDSHEKLTNEIHTKKPHTHTHVKNNL